MNLYDTQGRRLMRLFDGSLRAGGVQQNPVDTSGWTPGFYIYRLTGGTATATKKLVVLP